MDDRHFVGLRTVAPDCLATVHYGLLAAIGKTMFEDVNLPFKRLLTVQEATFIYGLGRSKFYQEVAAGKIRLRKCGRRTLVAIDDMEVWSAGLPTVNYESRAAG